MPITYRIDPELRLVEARYVGEVSIQDLREFATAVLNESGFGEDFRLLSVCEGMKVHVTRVEFMCYQEWRKPLPNYRQIAIVATTDYEFGIVRMYELTTDEVGAKAMRAFRSIKEARAWLGLPGS